MNIFDRYHDILITGGSFEIRVASKPSYRVYSIIHLSLLIKMHDHVKQNRIIRKTYEQCK